MTFETRIKSRETTRRVKAKKTKGGLSSASERKMKATTDITGRQLKHPQTQYLSHVETGNPLLGLHANFKKLDHHFN